MLLHTSIIYKLYWSFMPFIIFILVGAFDVVVRRPRHPGNHIDRIISCCTPIHGTLHIRLASLSCTAAAVAPEAASSSFSPSLMTTQPIRFNHCCACGGVFVVLFVVYDKDDTNSFILRLRRLCRSLRRRWRRTIRIHYICAFSGVFVVRSVVDDDKRYELIHVGNQHGLPFVGFLQSGDQPRLLLIAWL